MRVGGGAMQNRSWIASDFESAGASSPAGSRSEFFMSTNAVDKPADTRIGIVFHALCRKGPATMAKF
jgi:hypothetical protein